LAIGEEGFWLAVYHLAIYTALLRGKSTTRKAFLSSPKEVKCWSTN